MELIYCKTLNIFFFGDIMKTLDVKSAIQTAPSIRPEYLIMDDKNWRFLVRNVLRGKNTMLIGPAGCGKTLAVSTVANAMERPFFYFNLGATQDPRGALIGNMHFDTNTGTYFSKSTFVRAIQTPNAVILLDELSRAHPEAWNILMTVLDETQRYLRLDETPNGEVVKVANGVCFAATANFGMEYTSTREVDYAILDRFQLLKMKLLDKEKQEQLLKQACPDIDDVSVNVLTSVYQQVNDEIDSNSGKLTRRISTRTTIAAAELICDGFSVRDALEVSVFPYFSEDGGLESEQTYVRQIVQKYLPEEHLTNDNMFDENDAVDQA